MDADDPISPELVLVCPELRAVATPSTAPACPSPPPPAEPIATSSSALAAALPNVPFAVGVVAAIAYVVSAFTQ